MTIKQIKIKAQELGVPEIYCKARNKQQLLRSIDRWYSSLVDHMILLYYPDHKHNKEYKEAVIKRDNLRIILGIKTND